MRTTIRPMPATPLPERRHPPVGAALGVASIAFGVGSWVLLVGAQRGVALGGTLLLAGGMLLGRKVREYAGIALVTVGGLLGGVSLLWLLVFAPAIDRAEQQIHDLTHPSVDVGGAASGAVEKAKGAVDGLTGGRP